MSFLINERVPWGGCLRQILILGVRKKISQPTGEPAVRSDCAPANHLSPSRVVRGPTRARAQARPTPLASYGGYLRRSPAAGAAQAEAQDPNIAIGHPI